AVARALFVDDASGLIADRRRRDGCVFQSQWNLVPAGVQQVDLHLGRDSHNIASDGRILRDLGDERVDGRLVGLRVGTILAGGIPKLAEFFIREKNTASFRFENISQFFVRDIDRLFLRRRGSFGRILGILGLWIGVFRIFLVFRLLVLVV